MRPPLDPPRYGWQWSQEHRMWVPRRLPPERYGNPLLLVAFLVAVFLLFLLVFG